jgi:molybdate transport system ATP-binding protein
LVKLSKTPYQKKYCKKEKGGGLMSLIVDIKKRLGDFSLEVSFEAKDHIMAVLGASGCGKSVTLKCIAGIEKPDSGVIIVDGKTLFDSNKKINLPPRKRKVGYLFQNYALFQTMTVQENIGIGITKSKAEKEEMVDRFMKNFYLDGLRKFYPSQLSGGQQQRVALARILATQPHIIMLDEPFSALDSYLKWQLEQEMRTILSDFGGTTLFVSHNRDEVYRICDYISVLNDGKLEASGEKWEIFKNPRTYASAMLTGCKNFSTAKKIDQHTVKAIDWGVDLKINTEVPDNVQYVGVRAHQISVTKKPKYQNKNVIQCKVLDTMEDTFSVILMLQNVQVNSNSQFSRLRLEMDKESFKKDEMQNEIEIEINPDDLLLLTS